MYMDIHIYIIGTCISTDNLSRSYLITNLLLSTTWDLLLLLLQKC